MDLTGLRKMALNHLAGVGEDDDGLGRILRTYGEAMLFAQFVEVGAVAALALAEMIEHSDPVRIEAVVEKYHDQPLGATLAALRKSHLSHRPFVIELGEIKDRRNILAHEFLAMRFGHLLDPSTYLALQSEVEQERDYFVGALDRFEQWLGPPLLELLSNEEGMEIVVRSLEAGFDPYDRNN